MQALLRLTVMASAAAVLAAVSCPCALWAQAGTGISENDLDFERIQAPEEPPAGYSDRPVGTYKIGVGLLRPDFDDGLNHYEKSYANVNWYPQLQVDWMPLQAWQAAVGMKFGLGYYKDSGRALKAGPGGADDLIRDDSSRTHLLLVPMTAALNFTYTPFTARWISLDAWLGAEYVYYQETRGSTGDATGSEAAEEDGTATAMLPRLEDVVNNAWKTNSVIGASFNILLNWLDEGGPASMRGSMGLGYVYLSPFLQVTRALDDDGASFGRTEMGVAFRFESIR